MNTKSLNFVKYKKPPQPTTKNIEPQSSQRTQSHPHHQYELQITKNYRKIKGTTKPTKKK